MKAVHKRGQLSVAGNAGSPANNNNLAVIRNGNSAKNGAVRKTPKITKAKDLETGPYAQNIYNQSKTE